ncbi:MAG TPA: FAD-dependent oxidoreductase [Pseudonocardia sp.]|nr:FAD-dependent oxidoreductase [Pseudonocardia sp.]
MGAALNTPARDTPAPAALSLWHEQVAADGDPLTPRPALDGDTDADVCIVGAGFTGLWTAYALLRADPSVRVLVVERETAGFGASGRNGGWCSALFPASHAALARRHGKPAADAMRAAMRATVDEVGAVVAAEGIACDWRKGGTVVLARTPAQLARARAADAEPGPDSIRLLAAEEASALVGAAGVLGGSYVPDCARIQPARLARGLAWAAAPPVSAEPCSSTAQHSRPRRPLAPRAVVPVYSLIVATRPLPASFGTGPGWPAGRPSPTTGT